MNSTSRQSPFRLFCQALLPASTCLLALIWGLSQPAAAESSKNPAAAGAAATAASAKDESKIASERKPVLDPSKFFGFAAFGYAAAKNCPEVMEKIFCYCGCDLTDNHLTLLDCFTSMHGIDCHICQEEAVLANKLHKEGIPIAEIQKTIDEKYASQYPFETDTATYKKYKESRLYIKPKDPGSQIKFGTEKAGPEAPSDSSKDSGPPKLKPGREIGKCCAKGEHDKESKSKDQKKSKKKDNKDSGSGKEPGTAK